SSGGQSDDVANTLVEFGTGGEVKPGPSTPIDNEQTVVGLTLVNIAITRFNPHRSGTFEADVDIAFDVQWTTTLKAPQFSLSCTANNRIGVTSAQGTQHVTANAAMVLYPGTVTAYCYANSANGSSPGSAAVTFLVGDSDGATQRALQVETDSEALNLTLTA